MDAGMMDFSTEGSPSVACVVPGRTEATSMCYHENGQRLYVASEADAKLRVIDCLNGKADQPALRCDREGIHLIEPTHHEQSILFAGSGSSTQPVGQRNAICYWSLYDNKILRKFRGHSARVTGMSLSPADDTFLSCSEDRKVRLWNLKSAGCIGEMSLPDKTIGGPMAVFDSTGLVFAVSAAMAGGEGRYVHLYDARNYSGGAFAELKVTQTDIEKAVQSHISASPDRVSQLSRAKWTSLTFNVSGNQMLVGTDKNSSIIMDGFEGTIQRVLAGPEDSNQPAVACYTPDDKTIITGNDDGSVSCWSVDTGTMVKKLDSHPGPVRCVVANPKYAQFASSSCQTALWMW